MSESTTPNRPEKRLSYAVFKPNTARNPNGTQYLCEVRDGGFLVDEKHHPSEALAEVWGKNHDGTMSEAVGRVYGKIIGDKFAESPENPLNQVPLNQVAENARGGRGR